MIFAKRVIPTTPLLLKLTTIDCHKNKHLRQKGERIYKCEYKVIKYE